MSSSKLFPIALLLCAKTVCIFNRLAQSTSCSPIQLFKSHSSEIAAHKTVCKIICSIEGLHFRDKFRYPKTVTDVTITLIKKTFKSCR